MHYPKIPLQKWFLAIGLVIHAKKSLSSYQPSRDLDLNQKSAWYVQQRIRAAMAHDAADLRYRLVEADESYVGGALCRVNQKINKNSKLPPPPLQSAGP